MKFCTGIDHQAVRSNTKKDLHKIKDVIVNNVMILRPRARFEFWGWQGRRTSHVPPSLQPPLIFKPKVKSFATLPS